MRVQKLAPLAAAVALLATTTACGGDSDDEPAPTTESATTNADGTTVAGTELALGAPAVVELKADQKHASQIKLTVTKVQKGKIKDLSQFELNDAARKSTVYYVSTTVKNLGPDSLSNQKIVLYGKVSDELVVPPVSLESTFKRCDYTPLPEKFTKDKTAKGCMVMLAQKHGKISEIQWRDADEPLPISWTVKK